MARQATIRKMVHKEMHTKGSLLRDFILGWQDGLVNVLGVVLGVAAATESFKVIIVAAVAAALAETISMAAVAYTSFKAEADFYKCELNREKREMEEMPEREEEEIRVIYKRLGFKGSLLNKIVKHVISDKMRWLNLMMEQELKLFPQNEPPIITALIVGVSTLIGSIIPIVPFLFLPVKAAIIPTLIVAAIVLFFVGWYKSKTTIGNPIIGGIEMLAIGMTAALIGYGVGSVLGIVL